MKKQKGFSLIELLIVVVIIGIIAAIAIPNLLASRRSANEAASISGLRTIHGAQVTYASTVGKGSFAGNDGTLDTLVFTQLAANNLIDTAFGSATKSGYKYLGVMSTATPAGAASFCIRGVPVQNTGVASTGTRCFGVATDGVLMTNTASDTSNCGCSWNGNNHFVDRSSQLTN